MYIKATIAPTFKFRRTNLKTTSICDTSALRKPLIDSSNIKCVPLLIVFTNLPNMQSVYFQLDNEEEAVQRALTTPTKLTAWFFLNASSEHARQYLYTDIPLHFSFANNKWKERRRAQKVVTRLTHVFPLDLERYHLVIARRRSYFVR